MRLKYQLRGLGIGIILTAALLMIFSDDGEASVKTDTEMVVVSAETEMTEETVEAESSSVLQENVETQESIPEEETEEVLPEITTSEEESVSETTEEASVEESVVEKSDIEETTPEVASTEIESLEAESTETVTDDVDVVTIRIISGDDSGTVSRKLQTAGLVDNASEYDAYLMQHGYDKRISVGEVEIKHGSSWLEIAEKISGN